jgi:hypothetical protein
MRVATGLVSALVFVLAVHPSFADAAEEAKDAEAATRETNATVAKTLDFADREDFEDAKRGLIAPPTEGVITGAVGQDVWNLHVYEFLKQPDAPPTVNPSLWRQAELNMNAGLFKVVGRTSFTYYPGTIRIPESSAAPTKNRSHTITATVDVPRGGADGVLVAAGGVVGGYALYVKEGRPVYEYNFVTRSHTKVTGSRALAPGPNVIRVEFRYDGGGIGKGGTASLFVNGEKVGEGRIEATAWGRFSADETFDIGADTGSPVSADYASPDRFTGTIEKVVIDTQPANLNAAEKQTIQRAEQTVRLGTE